MTSKKADQNPPITVDQFRKLFNLDHTRANLLRRTIEKICVKHLALNDTAMHGGNKAKFPVAVEEIMKLEDVDKTSSVQRLFLTKWIQQFHSHLRSGITKPPNSSKEVTPVGADYEGGPAERKSIDTRTRTPKFPPKTTTTRSESDTEEVLTIKEPKSLPRPDASKGTISTTSKRKSNSDWLTGREDLGGRRASKRRNVEEGTGSRSLTSVDGNTHATQQGEQSVQVLRPTGIGGDIVEWELRKELVEKNALIAKLQDEIEQGLESLAEYRDLVDKLQDEVDFKLRRFDRGRFASPLYVPSSSDDDRREDQHNDGQL
ncbi:hypothetical protein DFP72DRAFT_1076632 [Ephemerocybe angulata]|uniref:Uncharacterized protein n=1 Tax=Ephemerocybe angulata TaxID=980116 RepID=A0A8H6LXT8_9AGAR|nr:hypothetical protein DFP72DRAFT_1076632 [Tulosesus angulatus]